MPRAMSSGCSGRFAIGQHDTPAPFPPRESGLPRREAGFAAAPRSPRPRGALYSVGPPNHCLAPLRALSRAALGRAAAAEGLPPGVAVGVLVCDDDEIARLNRDYAGEDHATDVLSFPGSQVRRSGDFRFAPGAERELGDIVLSLD